LKAIHACDQVQWISALNLLIQLLSHDWSFDPLVAVALAAVVVEVGRALVVGVATLLVTALPVADVANVDLTAALVVAWTTLFDALPASPQVPKPDWQPSPQYAAVPPHQPAGEQQLPKTDPWQVIPLAPPQVASVETFVGWVGGIVDVLLLLWGTLIPHWPNPAWHPSPQ
jgi:hypothetical protein